LATVSILPWFCFSYKPTPTAIRVFVKINAHEVVADDRATLAIIVGWPSRVDAKINVALLGLKLLQLVNNVG
jgi:hypothetical protein